MFHYRNEGNGEDVVQSDNQPLISVVTIVYNDKTCLEQTINSVLDQTYEYIEYIIVDGGSTDGTADVIEQYSAGIDHWVSEPDDGIYDAMNKGARLSTGSWIVFLNAGDSFHDAEVVRDVFSFPVQLEAEIVYGDAMQLFAGNVPVIREGRPIETIECDVPFIHQCTFVSAPLMQHCPFDLKYKISADYDFFFHMYRNGVEFHKIDRVISDYDMSGVSSHFFQTYKEMRMIQEKYAGDKAPCISRRRLAIIAVKEFFKSVLPGGWVTAIRVGRARKRV